MSDEIDTGRARTVATQLGYQIDAAIEMRDRFVTLGRVLESDGVFFVTNRLVNEFIGEVAQTAYNLRLAAQVAEGADHLGPELDRRLDKLRSDLSDGVGYSDSDADRRAYYESQTFTGYRGVRHGVDDDGTATPQEVAGVSVILRQLPPGDAADYWSTLPPEERRGLIRRYPAQVAADVIASGGTLTVDEQQLFEERVIATADSTGPAALDAIGEIEPGLEIPVLGVVSDAADAIAIGDEVVFSINGVPVAGRFVKAAGVAGTVASVGGVIAECADGIDGGCVGQAVVFVVDAVGTAVLGPVIYNAVKYTALGGIILLGLAQEQSPTIQPDWSGSGGGPGVAPYDGDSVADAPVTGRNDGGSGGGQAGRVMADTIGSYCARTSDEQVCGWGN